MITREEDESERKTRAREDESEGMERKKDETAGRERVFKHARNRCIVTVMVWK
jgi:hypothetical protein